MAVQLEPAFDKVFDTQRIYRSMLDAIARPGKICTLPGLELRPPASLGSFAAGMAFTLLDSETSFTVVQDSGECQEYIRLNTGSEAVPVESAEFIFAQGGSDWAEISGINRGSLLSPEEGSTLVLMVERLARDGQGVRLTLNGPGINGSISLVATGLEPAILDRVSKLNQEFPLGVDVFLVDSAGSLAAMPRSSSVDWEVV